MLVFLRGQPYMNAEARRLLDPLLEKTPLPVDATAEKELSRDVKELLFKLEFARAQSSQPRELVLQRLAENVLEVAINNDDTPNPYSAKLQQIAEQLRNADAIEELEQLRQRIIDLVVKSSLWQKEFQEKFEAQTRDILYQFLDCFFDHENPEKLLNKQIAEIKEVLQEKCDYYTIEHVQRRVKYVLQDYRDFTAHQRKERRELLQIITALGDALQVFQSGSDTFVVGINTYLEDLKNAKNLKSIDQLQAKLIDATKTILAKARDSAQQSQKLQTRLTAAQSRILVLEDEVEHLRGRLSNALKDRNVDALTALPNRRALDENLAKAYEAFLRHKNLQTLALIDIDHFKMVNDDYGHQTGDAVLKGLGEILRAHLRKLDFVARYGGEEFAMILPNTTARGGFMLLERIRKTVASSPFKLSDGKILHITISAGICELDPGMNPKTWIELADKALYAAKNRGRNQVRIAQDPESIQCIQRGNVR